MDSKDIKKIKKIVEEFFQKTTIPAKVEMGPVRAQGGSGKIQKKQTPLEINELLPEQTIPNGVKLSPQENIDTVAVDIKIDTPEILIGEKGRTLVEIQRLLRIILNKKIEKSFYIDLDINDYKKKKIEYLKSLAKDLADEVVLTKEEKVLFPMPAYERRIIHLELAERSDVTTESQGEGIERRVIIKPH